MLTQDEIRRYAEMLDDEYRNEIRPMMLDARNAIDPLFGLIKSKKYKDSCEMLDTRPFRFTDIPVDIRVILGAFRYAEHPNDVNTITSYSVPDSLVEYEGYSAVAFKDICGLWYVFTRSERYRNNDVEKVNRIKSIKMEFNKIRKCHNEFFVENGGQLFKDLAENVSLEYNSVIKKGKDADDDIRALFGEKTGCGAVKVTVTIEEV